MSALLALVCVCTVIAFCHRFWCKGLWVKLLTVLAPAMAYGLLDVLGNDCCDIRNAANLFGLLFVGAVFLLALMAARADA